MNKRILVPIVTGCVFATVFAAGCAANKRKPASVAPVVISTSETQTLATTTRPSTVESTVQRIITVYKEAPAEATTTTEETTTAETTKKPTKKPTATPKPTKKPTATPKPTKKPTKKPTAKPTVKKTTEQTAKANTLKTVSNNANTTDASKQITGIYRGSWSEITVDATNLQYVKFTATIHDPEDVSKASVWKMDGRYNPATGAVLYTNCTKTNYEYDENNNVTARKTAYSNGQGKIVISNGMITWHDYQEHAAEDMTFISAKSHDHG